MISDGRISNEIKCPFCNNAMFQSFFFDDKYWCCLWCRTAFPFSIAKEELQHIRRLDKQKESKRRNYQKNKTKILERNKKYYEKHKEKIKQYYRDYHRRNKDA